MLRIENDCKKSRGRSDLIEEKAVANSTNFANCNNNGNSNNNNAGNSNGVRPISYTMLRVGTITLSSNLADMGRIKKGDLVRPKGECTLSMRPVTTVGAINEVYKT